VISLLICDVSIYNRYKIFKSIIGGGYITMSFHIIKMAHDMNSVCAVLNVW